jgi:hypothetical protein
MEDLRNTDPRTSLFVEMTTKALISHKTFYHEKEMEKKKKDSVRAVKSNWF